VEKQTTDVPEKSLSRAERPASEIKKRSTKEPREEVSTGKAGGGLKNTHKDSKKGVNKEEGVSIGLTSKGGKKCGRNMKRRENRKASRWNPSRKAKKY